jgi:hypothetical protein
MWIWTRLRNIGGNPDEEADLREELSSEDAGEAEEKYLGGAGFGAGLNVGDAAEVAEADLEETKPPPDPAP